MRLGRHVLVSVVGLRCPDTNPLWIPKDKHTWGLGLQHMNLWVRKHNSSHNKIPWGLLT